MPCRHALPILICAVLSACGGGGGGGGGSGMPAASSGTPVSSAGASPAALAALPSHVSPSRLLRLPNGCYGYRVGSPGAGYDAAVIAADGTPVCP